MPSTRVTPRHPGGVCGSCGWHASRTRVAVATGTTAARKRSIRSQFSSSEITPARVGDVLGSTQLHRNALLREPPRPSSGAVRRTPRTLRLYLAAGIPAAASRSISPHRLSISSCHSGPLAIRTCGLSCARKGPAEIGNCTMSSDRPKDSTWSLCRRRASRLHSSGLPGGSTQTWVTPSWAQTW